MVKWKLLIVKFYWCFDNKNWLKQYQVSRSYLIYCTQLKVSKEKIQQIENSLLQAIALYKRRIEWLTCESRRLFGVIEEHCITIILDIKTNSPAQFEHCRNAIIRVLEEQVTQLAKFNLIRLVWLPPCSDAIMYCIHCASFYDRVYINYQCFRKFVEDI